jgi:dihydrofolate reductase
MRKLTAYLLISLDGVCEAPDTFAHRDVMPDLFPLIADVIAEQDAVLMGRRTYDDWSGYWPTSGVEPFASFINHVPKFVASTTMTSADWNNTSLLSSDLPGEVAALKASTGGTIGVHGSLSLVQSLLRCGTLDELRLAVLPVVAGTGRRLFDSEGGPLHFTLVEARWTESGVNLVTYRSSP